MIKVLNIKTYTIDYECDCGVIGECMFKPPKEEGVLVIDIQCPMCEECSTIEILKYKNEEDKERILNDGNRLHWSVVVDNKIKQK